MSVVVLWSVAFLDFFPLAQLIERAMTEYNERSPLLRNANLAAVPPGAPTAPVQLAVKDVKVRPGPLEIARSNRYAILAGIWTATFLSVSVPRASGNPF